MDQWLAIAEKFGISVVMLIGVSWGMVKLFQWMAHTMMKQISLNQERTESINIKLIDAINQLRAEIKELKVKLQNDNHKIQCIVSKGFIDTEIDFGETQNPNLWDFADGINTLDFLSKI